MRIAPSVARLAAQTQESITITFSPEYRPATPGSASSSIIARNIRVTVDLPDQQPSPSWILARMLARTAPSPDALIDQYIVLQAATDRDFGGEAPFPLIIETSSSGRTQSYNQKFNFSYMYGLYNEDYVVFELGGQKKMLIDPINHSPQFQVNMFEASPYSRTDMGLWSSIPLR